MIFCILFSLLWIPISLLYPTKVVGKKNLLKKQACVFTCNHYSNLDPIILNIRLNTKMRFLAKKELFKNRFMAWIMRGLGAFPVDRQKMEISTFKFAMNALKENKILGIFPEGTRNKSNDDSLKEVKSGAVVFAGKAGAPIIPAMFYKRSKMFRRNYLLIGEPFMVDADNPKKMTQEEIDQNTKRLSEIMNKLKEDFELNRLLKKQGKNTKQKDEVRDDDMKNVKVSKLEKVENRAVRVFDEVLEPGEKIIKSLSPVKWKIYFFNIIKPFLVYCLFVLLFIALFFIEDDGVSKQDSLIFLYFVSGFILILETIIILITKKSVSNMYYIITESRVISSQGLLSCDFKWLELKNIKDVQLKWDFIDKLSRKKTGQIQFIPSDKSKSSVLFLNIENPLDVYIEIQETLEKNNA